MAEKAASGGGTSGKWPMFPCEDPTHPELDKYFRTFDDELKNHESSYLIRGETPPSLIGVAEGIDMTTLVELPEPDAAALANETMKSKMDRVKFNLQISQTVRAEKARQDRFDAGIADLKNSLASVIASTMRDSAPGRLRSLKKACEMDHSGKSHDGVKMYNTIVALKSEDGPTAKRSSKWHEQQYNKMCTEQLPDHCSAEQYAKKINNLMEIHLPNFKKIRLEGRDLSEVYIDWMPHYNATDGRGLLRSLEERQAVIDAAKARIARMTDGALKTAAEASLMTLPYVSPPISPKLLCDTHRVGIKLPRVISGCPSPPRVWTNSHTPWIPREKP